MIKITSFGCRLNSFESEIIRHRCEGSGLKNIVVIHSCAVTGEAERQARQAARTALKQGARVIVAGCSAQKSAESFVELGVAAVFGNKEKLEESSYKQLAKLSPDAPTLVLASGEPSRQPEVLPERFELKTKAFIQIQQGCDYACAYCVVPALRGKSQSFSREYIFSQIKTALAGGYKEVVLTGVDIASYDNLKGLIRETLVHFPNLPRLRLSSLDPAKGYEWLFRLMADEPRLMPHLHLSLQSGDDSVLKSMGRRHKSADIRKLVASARGFVPHIGLGADIIAGFPGEKPEHFENTYRLIEECRIALLHVFPYSRREGTRAATMPGQVPEAEKKSRAGKLRRLGEKLRRDFISTQIGTTRPVLVEANGVGYTDNYIKVKVNAPENTIVNTGIFNASVVT